MQVLFVRHWQSEVAKLAKQSFAHEYLIICKDFSRLPATNVDIATVGPNGSIPEAAVA
jgi:hypothetical protein